MSQSLPDLGRVGGQFFILFYFLISLNYGDQNWYDSVVRLITRVTSYGYDNCNC